MIETLRDFIEHASRSVDLIFRKTGIIRPMWHAFTRDGVELIFPTISPDKDTEVAMVRALFELRDVVRYAFIDEAWIVEAVGDDATPAKIAAVKRAAITGASALPARREVVMFCTEDHAEGMIMARRRIIRPAAGRPTLEPLQFDPPGGLMHGRMVGLLPKPKRESLH